MSTTDSRTLHRRQFVRLAAASAGLFSASGVLASCDVTDTTHTHVSPLEPSFAPGGKATVTRNALRIPATVAPTNLTLRAQAGVADLGGGRTSTAWLYNGQFPGPTLVASTGSSASLKFENALSQQSITHWHGMVVPHLVDGHPHQVVSSGNSYVYPIFTIQQRAALNWYHPHPHKLTGEQVYRGLAGAFIVRDGVEAALNLPSGAYEVPLIIRDASFDSNGNFTFKSSSSGFFGNTPLINGTLAPFLAVDRAVYRFRVLNGCNARVLTLALGNGAAFTLIGNDGGLLESAVQLQQIQIGPGERLDLLVDFRGYAQNQNVMLRCVAAGWDLLEFRGSGQGSGAGSLPTALSTISPLTAPKRTRFFSFDGMTKVNGRVYDMMRIDFNVPFGETELWQFRTNGNGPHPVHVHGASFQVQSRAGGRGQVFPWERGWKDTVLVGDGETVEVLIRFDAFKGLYLLHCHQLGHEDNGMMSNFEVV